MPSQRAAPPGEVGQPVRGAAPETTAHVSPSLCRGCNLCVAICPTDAAVSSVESPQWWGSRLDDLYRPFVESVETGGSCVVVTCQRRAAGVESAIAQYGVDAELAVVRCAGELDAGQLLEMYRSGADAVLIAGCLSDQCRYGDGSQMAVEQLRRAHDVLRSIGADPSNGAIVRIRPRRKNASADPSGDQAGAAISIKASAMVIALEPSAFITLIRPRSL